MWTRAAGATVLAAAAVLGLAGLVPSSGGEQPVATLGADTTTVTGTVREVLFSTTCKGTPGAPTKLPCREVYLGVGKSPQGARQVVYATDTYTGHPSRNTYTYRATNDSYDVGGTLSSAYTGKNTIRGGKMFGSGQGPITGGTGAYAGITGTLSFRGSNRVGARVTTWHWRATVTLP